LFGSFSVVVALLLIWILVLWFDLPGARRIDRALLFACGATVLLIGVGLWCVLQSMSVLYYQDFGDHRWWNRTGTLHGVCEEAKPFLGTWQVASSQVPFLGQEIPYSQIELRRDLTISASRGEFSQSDLGQWGPPTRRGEYGWISTDRMWGVWNFELNEQELTLTTPQEMELPISRIVLKRL